MRCRTTTYIVAALCLLLQTPAQADIRSEAMAMLAKLRQEGIASRFPEELRSLDATVATGEMYYQLNEPQQAERYYRLATQKGLRLQERLEPAPRLHSQHPALSRPPVITTLDAPSEPAGNTEPRQQTEETPAPAPSPAQPIQSAKLVGTIGRYTVVKNDTLRLVASKLGVRRSQLIAQNRLNPKAYLRIGQVLRYNNQRIIPYSRLKNGILINIPDLMLYYFQKGRLAYATAVALGTPERSNGTLWQTPVGRFWVINKAKEPTWTVPLSIQEEMRHEGREVITSIPPGADNPLGKYALKTSLPGILIHSTSEPWSIYSYASHGCIRVYPDRMKELFKVVKVNTPGEIIYRPVKAAVTGEGRILLEVHGDIYAKTKGLEYETKTLLHAMKIAGKVDWTKVRKVIAHRSGVAEEVTRETTESRHRPPEPSQDQSPS